MPLSRVLPLLGLLCWTAVLATPTPEPAPAAPPTPVQRLQALVAQRPDDGVLRFYLAMRLAAAGEPSAAVKALRDAADRVDGLLPITDEQFPTLVDRDDYQALRAELEANLPRVTDRARPWARLRDRLLLPEGIAHDPVDRATYVTSMHRGTITRLDDDGQETVWQPPGPAPLIGAVVDPEARHLHVVRSNGFQTAPVRVNQIETYALATGQRVAVRPVPEARSLNDVTLGPDGSLFASDSMGGRVFWLRADGRVDALTPALSGPNGLAFDAGRGVLFVAHTGGVARFTFDGEAPQARLHLPARAQIAAIDGLILLPDRSLVGVQNTTTPARVLRLHLDAAGRRVERLEVLLSHHHPDLHEPTTITRVDSTRLRLLATTQVSRLQPDGQVADPGSVRAPVVLELQLDER